MHNLSVMFGHSHSLLAFSLKYSLMFLGDDVTVSKTRHNRNTVVNEDFIVISSRLLSKHSSLETSYHPRGSLRLNSFPFFNFFSSSIGDGRQLVCCRELVSRLRTCPTIFIGFCRLWGTFFPSATYAQRQHLCCHC